MDHAEVMNRCGDRAMKLGLAALTPVERVVALVSIANFEIELGSIDSFYYNSAGDNAVETVSALEAVGALKAAKALRGANALFSKGPPKNRKRRFDELQRIRPGKSLQRFDQDFNSENPDVFSKLCEYIEKHESELRS